MKKFVENSKQDYKHLIKFKLKILNPEKKEKKISRTPLIADYEIVYSPSV